jgi:hypothetical protein
MGDRVQRSPGSAAARGATAMNKKTLSVLAATLWAGAAIASASPAHALVYGFNISGGSYLSCSQNYTADYVEACGYVFNYNQTVKFITTTCNSGSCAVDGHKYVEQVYGAGRKTVSLLSYCDSGTDPDVVMQQPMGVWAVGTCGC